MIDIEERLETSAQSIRSRVDAAPVRPVAEIVRRHRRSRTLLAGAGSVAIWMAVAGIVALVAGDRAVSSRPGPTLESAHTVDLIPGFAVPVSDGPVEAEGALVYEAEPGPSIESLDTSELGTEVVVTRGGPESLVVPVSDNPGNALQADRLVYLGDLGSAQLALHSFNGNLMVFLGNGTRVTGGGTCVTADGLAGGDYTDPEVGEWLVWTRLPESAAIVVGETTDGSRYWQRTIGRTVVFILPDKTTVDPALLSAFDVNGTEVATTRGLELDLAAIGFPPADKAPPDRETDQADC